LLLCRKKFEVKKVVLRCNAVSLEVVGYQLSFPKFFCATFFAVKTKRLSFACQENER